MTDLDTLRPEVRDAFTRAYAVMRTMERYADMDVIRAELLRLADIEAELSALKAKQWQPIETAPKDQAILAYGFGFEVAHFNTRLGPLVACWDHREIHGATHWIPLPEPPAARGKE